MKSTVATSSTRHPAFAAVLLLSATALLFAGCGEDRDERLQGPVSSFEVRRFAAPGQSIAQALDAGGRALIFLELTDVQSGRPLATDPGWTFKVVVRSPSGAMTPLLADPVIPSAWAADEGVRFIAGFEATARGSYQVDISSPDCPPRAAPMVMLPIN